jgi:hypothetical protein
MQSVVIGGSLVIPPPPDAEALKKFKEVDGHKFGDGGKLLISDEVDEHGLPVAYIQHAEPVVPVEAHPRHPGIVTRGGETRADFVTPGEPVPLVTRVPVAQIVELVRAGVLKKPEPKAA